MTTDKSDIWEWHKLAEQSYVDMVSDEDRKYLMRLQMLSERAAIEAIQEEENRCFDEKVKELIDHR